MAIIKLLPGVEVSITVDGSDLKELVNNAAKEPDRIVTRYIEVKDTQMFGVRVKVAKAFQFKESALIFHILIDGQLTKGTIVENGDMPKDLTIHGIGAGDSLSRYRFTSLEVG